MEELPKVAIPLQGIGAPGPQLGAIKDGISFVAESPTVCSKVNREGLGKGSQTDSKLGPGAGSKAPSKDTSSNSTVGDARGQCSDLHEFKLRGGKGAYNALRFSHAEGRCGKVT